MSTVSGDAPEQLTVELCDLGEGGVLPDNHVVVGVSVGRDQLLVIGRKHQRGDLKRRVMLMLRVEASPLPRVHRGVEACRDL